MGANLDANEVCWKKCNISLESSKFDKHEEFCMRTCQAKFGDVNLLVESEVENYTRGFKF